ncbi:unnamed protein product, partial [Rotaria sp. Silwood1]
ELKIINLNGLHVSELNLVVVLQITAHDIDESVEGICLIQGLYSEGAGWGIENRSLIKQSNTQLI